MEIRVIRSHVEYCKDFDFENSEWNKKDFISESVISNFDVTIDLKNNYISINSVKVIWTKNKLILVNLTEDEIKKNYKFLLELKYELNYNKNEIKKTLAYKRFIYFFKNK